MWYLTWSSKEVFFVRSLVWTQHQNYTNFLVFLYLQRIQPLIGVVIQRLIWPMYMTVSCVLQSYRKKVLILEKKYYSVRVMLTRNCWKSHKKLLTNKMIYAHQETIHDQSLILEAGGDNAMRIYWLWYFISYFPIQLIGLLVYNSTFLYLEFGARSILNVLFTNIVLMRLEKQTKNVFINTKLKTKRLLLFQN